VDRPEAGVLLVGRAVEDAQPADDGRRVLTGGVDRRQRLERLVLVENAGLLEQQLAVTEDQPELVIEVVGDAARHLPHRSQSFLLEEVLLRVLQLGQCLAEALVRLLQLAVAAAGGAPIARVIQGGAHRWPEPAEAVLEHALGRAGAHALGRDLVAKRVGHHHQRDVGAARLEQGERPPDVEGGQRVRRQDDVRRQV
jgi:hypothetical protein